MDCFVTDRLSNPFDSQMKHLH